MKSMKKTSALILAGAMALTLAACGSTSTPAATQTPADNYQQNTAALTFDGGKWSYDADHDVYWQIQVAYCAAPQASDYETMGIYVPGAYMTATANADGTYTCKVNTEGKVGNYTATSAPIVIPVNTPGYSASAAPTEYAYDSISDYMTAGLIYLQPGFAAEPACPALRRISPTAAARPGASPI